MKDGGLEGFFCPELFDDVCDGGGFVHMQMVTAVQADDADILGQAVAVGQVMPVRGKAAVAFNHQDRRGDARDEFLHLFFG